MNKTVGSIFLVAGTAIGAGMLGLPLAAGLVGFKVSILVLILIWALMTYTGLLVLEVNLTLPTVNNSFKSMAQKTLGPFGSIVSSITLMLLLYSLTGAYISGSGSMLSMITGLIFHVSVPNWLNSIIFTCVLGSLIFHSTQLVDKTNQLVLSIKGILILLILALLMPKIHYANLLHSPKSVKSLLLVAPIFLTSFGFHTVIPSITNYIGKQARQLQFIIIIGALIPFIIYLFWLVVTLGLIPQVGTYSFAQIHHHDGIACLLCDIMHLSHSHWVSIFINLFGNIAMITSFLGVTLGLFDFLHDVCKRDNSKKGRIQTAALTYLPPLIFSFIYPQGFYFGLSLAAIFVAILEVILPASMVFSLRRNQPGEYQVKGGRFWLLLVFISGLALIGCAVIR